MGLVWKAAKITSMSLAETNCKHVKEDVLMIGWQKNEHIILDRDEGLAQRCAIIVIDLG
jgi:hypothetical protein